MFSTCQLVRLFVCDQTCGHDILKTNEPISTTIGTTGPRSTGMKRPTLGVRRSKVKVTGGRRWIWRPGGGIILDRRESNTALDIAGSIHGLD